MRPARTQSRPSLPRGPIPRGLLAAGFLTSLLVLSGCGGGGSSSSAPPPVAPDGLTYPAAPTLFVGVAMAPLSPTLATGSASSYSVTPALPAGVSLNTSTGVISGTPSAVTALATYTITATNSSGSTTFDLDLEVVLQAPSGLTYPAAPTLFVGIAMTPLTPTLAVGIADGFSVLPALPAGLSLDPVSGVISGTPTTATGPATYTITATNAAGSTTFDLDLEVQTPATPDVEFAGPTSSAPESSASASVTVTLSVPSVLDVTIPFVLSGTATAGDDYTAPTSPIVITAGATAGTIDIPILDDGLSEGDETVVIDLQMPTNGNLGATVTHTLTIADDDGAAAVQFSASNLTFTEGTGAQTIELALSPPSAGTVDVTLGTSGTASSGSDYTLATTSVTFLSGETSQLVGLTLLDDAIYEGDEELVVTILAVTGANIGTVDEVTITIPDDEAPPTAEFTQTLLSVIEDGAAVDVTVGLSGISALDASLTYTVTGTATGGGVDYTITPASPLVITAGSQNTTVTVTPTDDGVPEPIETVVVTLTAATGATIGPNGAATFEINDPCTLVYDTPDAVYGPQVPITPNAPVASVACTGINNFTVNPALPAGLSLDSSTGVISGTPTTLQPETSYTIDADGPSGPVSTVITIRVDQVFTLTANSPIVPFDPALGVTNFDLTVTLEEDPSGSPAAFTPVSGFSFGLRVEPTEIVINSAAEGVDSVALNGGGGADFFTTGILMDGTGITVGVIVSLTLADTLIANGPQQILDINASSVPAFLQANPGGIDVTLPFDGTLGVPPVSTLIVHALGDSDPITIPPTISFVP